MIIRVIFKAIYLLHTLSDVIFHTFVQCPAADKTKLT